MDRMVIAGWLHSYTYTDGKGFHLTWEVPAGTERAILLKKIIESFRVQSDDRAPMVFDKIARGESLPSYGRAFNLDAEVAGYWIESVDQLGIARDEDTLLWFTHIITGWAPDDQTPMKFGFQ
jgi:hypothetical protein